MTKSRLFNDTPYLAFQPHDTQIDASLNISKKDIEILRSLALRISEIASLPIQEIRKKEWANINDLRGGKPVIWMNEICWHEMNVEDELTNLCENEVALRIETQFRRTLYQWNHMQGDMIIEPILYSPYIISNSGVDLTIDAEIAESNIDSTIASRHFNNQLKSIEDIEKIKMPLITHHVERTDAFYQVYKNIFNGILPVEKRGCTGFWFAPWDDIVFWMGAENVLVNLVAEPELMHAIIDRVVSAYEIALDQLLELGLVASNNSNVRVGSGGYGYTSELPAADDKMNSFDIWGCATPQIFGSVSPMMHKEFGLEYEMRWLSRFGLNYYGCCEPLHGKLDILSKIPNLRKISISPWADVSKAAEGMKNKYVMSLKPSPSSLAFDNFDETAVEKELTSKLLIAKDCCVEIILKDISTVRNEPQRLWRWADIATRIVQKIS